MNYIEYLSPYSPWLLDKDARLQNVPQFRRPLFYTLMEDLEKLSHVLSVTGPRRIGKTTLLHQLIEALLSKGIPHQRIIYYSLDDPALSRRGVDGAALLERIMKELAREKQPAYLFLDEVQRMERWELYIKKYYDLKYPVRIVISGSASSPIFKKSRESLLGRVKDYHLLPFSFREFLLYRLRDDPIAVAKIDRLHEQGRQVQGVMSGDPAVSVGSVNIGLPERPLQERMQQELEKYFMEGGFPEVWTLPDWVAKQDYLFDNQVKKVIYEDLVLAVEFRKPELLKRFYVSLLEAPGREVNIQKLAGEIDTSAAQIEKYLPLLEMTDLVYHLDRFRRSPLRVRKGRMKFYLVDLALRNAVLRLTETLLDDQAALGLYAENLVYLALRKWRGTIQMDYFRDREREVDFIVHVGPRAHVPVEVKYQEHIRDGDLATIKSFVKKHNVKQTPIVVTKRWEDYGRRGDLMLVPLVMFLTMFD